VARHVRADTKGVEDTGGTGLAINEIERDLQLRVKIFLFVAVLLASMWGLDRLYTFALLYNQNLKLTSVAAHPRNAELLIHGPCEPLWMVSPPLIDPHTGVSSYNLAL